MKTIKLNELLSSESLQEELLRSIKSGRILVYPTDTIYGLGCSALDREAVGKLRKLKNTKKPFSVIAPSKEWILENLEAKPEHLEKLPGPYTLIFKMRDNPVPLEVSQQTLGVRIPDHPITSLIQKSGAPLITTSVNVSGEPNVTKISEIPERISREVDVAVDAGVLDNPPSAIIDFTGPKPIKRTRAI